MQLEENESRYQAALLIFVEQALKDNAIYHNNYLAVRQGALRNNYPLVNAVLGEAVFAALAKVYAIHFPSSDWDINLYGEQFSDLLSAQHKSQLGQRYDWINVARMAKLEYQLLPLYYHDSSAANHCADLGSFGRHDITFVETLMKNLSRHHQWLSLKTGSNLLNKNFSEVKLLAERHLSSYGFSFTLKLVPSNWNL